MTTQDKQLKREIAEVLNDARKSLEASEPGPYSESDTPDGYWLKDAIYNLTIAVGKLAGLKRITRGSCSAAKYEVWSAEEDEG